MYEVIVAYLVLGIIAGLLAGLLGVGGGLVIVPSLVAIFVYSQIDQTVLMHLAIATSLATIILTSISSTWAHHRRGAVLWPVCLRLTPGIVIGVLAGALLADRLSSLVLMRVFAVFEMLVAIQMWYAARPPAEHRLPGAVGMGLAGGVIGSVSAIIGIGGGTLTVPFLHWCRVGIHQAVATSAACGFPIAVSGMVVYLVLGLQHDKLPQHTLGYIHLPALFWVSIASLVAAPLGARLAHYLPLASLKRVFAAILLLIGVRMLVSSI